MPNLSLFNGYLLGWFELPDSGTGPEFKTQSYIECFPI